MVVGFGHDECCVCRANDGKTEVMACLSASFSGQRGLEYLVFALHLLRTHYDNHPYGWCRRLIVFIKKRRNYTRTEED